MIDTKDWISFFVGLVLTVTGVLPLMNKFGIGPEWFKLEILPVNIFSYIVAIAGFYLMVNSVIEITNSNAIGWISFLIAVLIMASGILQVLHKFAIGPTWFELTFISDLVYYIVFTVEGIFLMIATFAMNL
ncbi:MAG: hypothetical protein QS98_C0008G0022 [archaeon GW2011_AR3]|nr:MAG: hypothetical protein QS98_C0008G0022 [archaeon GW2011_AR3]